MSYGRIEAGIRSKLRRSKLKLEDSPLAGGAVSLAAALDQETDTVKLATGLRELRMLLGELGASTANPSRSPAVPESESEVDPVDDLAMRRADRRGTAG